MNRMLKMMMLLAVLILAAANATRIEAEVSIQKSSFGNLPDGTQIDKYELTNDKGASAAIITYGGYVVSLKMPDRDGKLGEVIVGYDTLEGYLNDSMYLGALIGRFGNRIGGGKFTIDGHTVELPVNNDPNTLHGGPGGFHTVVWDAEPVRTNDGPAVKLSYLSKDGEMGFPGNLHVDCLITLTGDNALKFEFAATTDKPTVCNLTNHAYFNLDCKGDILDHEMTFNCDFFTPLNEFQVPTGEIRPVAGTPFDFTSPHTIGERIDMENEQLGFGKGYDHNWVINKPEPGQLALAVTVHEPHSGRVLEVYSTAPGVQFYSGNFMDGTSGRDGFKLDYRHAFCLEPQGFPDSPNISFFPSTTLRPGETYEHTMMYKFSTR